MGVSGQLHDCGQSCLLNSMLCAYNDSVTAKNFEPIANVVRTLTSIESLSQISVPLQSITLSQRCVPVADLSLSHCSVPDLSAFWSISGVSGTYIGTRRAPDECWAPNEGFGSERLASPRRCLWRVLWSGCRNRAVHDQNWIL